jgi:pilus assembly protein CpaE
MSTGDQFLYPGMRPILETMRSILISPDESQRELFQVAAHACRHAVGISKALDAYPEPAALSRMIRAWAPEVIFLSMDDPEAAEVVSKHISQEFSGIHQIALHTTQNPDIFRRALRLKMRELLVSPFDPAELLATLEQVSEELSNNPVQIGSTDLFNAFLPAKSGVGTSTIAANVTWALSKQPDTPVLLMDCDLFSGVTGFLFNAEHEYSLADATNRSKELDEDAWQRLVKKVGNIDLLLSGAPRIPDQLQHKQLSGVIEFARRNYRVINADLPDTLDDMNLTLLREANRIFLTTTPELPSLRLAKLKVLTLRKLELEGKATLLVNRFSKRSELTLEEIERTVGLPVFASFGCEYADVMKSATDARPSPKLADSFNKFAEKLLNKKIHESPRSRFIERFAVVPMRYGFR